MAARTHAAAPLGPDSTVSSFICDSSLSDSLLCLSRSSMSECKYSRQFLLHIGRTAQHNFLQGAQAETLGELGILRQANVTPDPTAPPPPGRRRRRRCERKHKRGKRGGIRARLAANPNRPAIPSILLDNVRSLDNEMDHIRLLRSAQRCVFVFMETWLNDNTPDSAIHLDRLTCHRADRALVNGGKTRGGGVCAYISDAWCRDSMVVCKHCSPLAEFMIMKCRPFYLPREITAILLVAV